MYKEGSRNGGGRARLAFCPLGGGDIPPPAPSVQWHTSGKKKKKNFTIGWCHHFWVNWKMMPYHFRKHTKLYDFLQFLERCDVTGLPWSDVTPLTNSSPMSLPPPPLPSPTGYQAKLVSEDVIIWQLLRPEFLGEPAVDPWIASTLCSISLHARDILFGPTTMVMMCTEQSYITTYGRVNPFFLIHYGCQPPGRLGHCEDSPKWHPMILQCHFRLFNHK